MTEKNGHAYLTARQSVNGEVPGGGRPEAKGGWGGGAGDEKKISTRRKSPETHTELI